MERGGGEIILTEDEAGLLLVRSPLPNHRVPSVVFAAQFRLRAIETQLNNNNLPDGYRSQLLATQEELGPVVEALGGFMDQIMQETVERLWGDPGADG